MTDSSIATTYIEHATTLAVPGWEIPAALTLPAEFSPGKLVPSAMLLVPGSLFSDVNGDFPSWNSFPHVYAHLARQLSSLGHAVYRYAKLGPGTGSVPTNAADGIPRTWEGRLQMTIAALDGMLKELEKHKVVAERIVGAGHSEGSVAISRLAITPHGKMLDGVVLLAGPSVGILEIMREQAHMGVPADRLDDARRRLDDVIAYVRRGQPVPPHVAGDSPYGAGALARMPDEARQYMRDVDATDPKALVRQFTQPTLIVQGGDDTSVRPHHGEALRDARGAGGEYLFVPGVSHMFKVVPKELSDQEAFGYSGPVDWRVTRGVDRWIRAAVAPRS